MGFEGQLRMLREVLELLASSPEAQEAYVLSNGVGVDELALGFDDVYPVFRAHDVGSIVVPSAELSQIDHLLGAMSTDCGLWTLEALHDSAEWENVRQLARRALERM